MSRLVDENQARLVDESTKIHSLVDLSEARLLADAILKVHNLHFTAWEIASDRKIQRQKAKGQSKDIRDLT